MPLTGPKEPVSPKLVQIRFELVFMAEAQGFEPWGRFHARRFSRPVHSTTLPNLRGPPVVMLLNRFGKPRSDVQRRFFSVEEFRRLVLCCLFTSVLAR